MRGQAAARVCLLARGRRSKNRTDHHATGLACSVLHAAGMDLLPWHHTRLRVCALALLAACALAPRMSAQPHASRSSPQNGHRTNTYTNVTR